MPAGIVGVGVGSREVNSTGLNGVRVGCGERSRRRRLDYSSAGWTSSSSLPLRKRIAARISLLLLRRFGATRMNFERILSMLLVTSNAGTYAENLLAVTYTLSWMCVSSGLVMLNKHILSGLRFEYPLTLCSLGMLFSGLVSAMLFKGMGIGKATETEPMTPASGSGGEGNSSSIEKSKSDAMSWEEYARTILPIGLASSLTLYWGNYAYLWLSVSFIQMLKAFTPVVTMVVLFAFGMEKFESNLILSVVLMTLGTALASYGETDFSVVGFVSMAISEVMEALKLVAMQFLLAGAAHGNAAAGNQHQQRGMMKQTRKFGLFEGLYYFAPATVFWLGIGIVYSEGPRLLREGGLQIMRENMLIFLAASVRIVHFWHIAPHRHIHTFTRIHAHAHVCVCVCVCVCERERECASDEVRTLVVLYFVCTISPDTNRLPDSA